MKEHKHTILIIKNKEKAYLQYYDLRWNSYLFFNTKIVDSLEEDDIKEKISQELHISKDKIEVTILFDKVHSKFSESAQKEKLYHHYFYQISFKEEPDFFKKKEFTINETKYKWFKMSELENNQRIQKVNSDIVGFIKEQEQKSR